MKQFYCYIKSHCSAPDWEQEVKANSLEEACKKFALMANGSWEDSRGNAFDPDWSPAELLPFVEEVREETYA